ncbi:hypothetical protein Esti_000147 [Eimeria stiedai]
MHLTFDADCYRSSFRYFNLQEQRQDEMQQPRQSLIQLQLLRRSTGYSLEQLEALRKEIGALEAEAQFAARGSSQLLEQSRADASAVIITAHANSSLAAEQTTLECEISVLRRKVSTNRQNLDTIRTRAAKRRQGFHPSNEPMRFLELTLNTVQDGAYLRLRTAND